jgi:hypothetical protein
VPDDRLNFPFSGSLATVTSLTWGLGQALFVVTLLGFARSGAVGASRPGRIGAWLAVVGGIVSPPCFTSHHYPRDCRADPVRTSGPGRARRDRPGQHTSDRTLLTREDARWKRPHRRPVDSGAPAPS